MTSEPSTDPDLVRVAGEDLNVHVALLVAAGYCLGEEPLKWSPPANGVGGEPELRARGAFAYRSYDGIPAASTSHIQPIDVLVGDGLNAQMRAKDIASVLAVAPDLSVPLEMIDAAAMCFWELPRGAVVAQPADEAQPGWPLWRAWTILGGVEGIDVARTHKILHHKRPRAFPLIDNKTIECLGTDGTAWAAIHEDLTATAEAWEWLEDAISKLVVARNLPSPTRLRLHDILIWTRATGRRDAALREGCTFLGVA